jgi:hypothetical protein
MRALKVFGIVLGAIISAFILLLLAVWLLVNPESPRRRIRVVLIGTTMALHTSFSDTA